MKEIDRRKNNLIGDKIKSKDASFNSGSNFKDSKIAFVIKYATGKRVLDLGCVMHDPQSYKSEFWVHKAIKEKASYLIGLDLSEVGVNYLKNLEFNILSGDAQNFDLAEKFEVIHAGDLIEHLEDFSGFLQSCSRHLTDEGVLIVSSPNPWYWRNVVKSILKYEVPTNPEHTCWLCPRTLRQLVQRHNFDVVDIKFGSRYLKDRLLPLPRGIKHTSWSVAIKRIKKD